MVHPLQPSAPPDEATRPSRSLLIEGWRGINHSFALVSQNQILELLKLDGLRLFHRDMPFAFGHWNEAANGAGFSAEQLERIAALADPGDAAVDCVYRICSPFRAGPAEDRRKTVTFMVTEMGLSRGNLEAGDADSGFFTRDDNSIVTCTRWSRDRIVEHGFAPEKVHVIPHGVDAAAFSPLDRAERAVNRAALGFGEDETVFLNVGAPLWNKGTDLLLLAFAALRDRGRRVRLVLKDQKDLYGLSVERLIRDVGAGCPSLLSADTLAAISVVSTNMDRGRMRLLYGVADGYVSPYRAEGFNLPVLEAVACGTPAIVTRGGATDDFCCDDVAVRLPGRPGDRVIAADRVGRYIEPDLDALVEAMDGVATGRRPDGARHAAARARVLRAFDWRHVASRLAEITVGYTHTAAADAVPASAPRVSPVPRAVGQRDVLDVVAMLRPLLMASTPKVRVGNAYDGGYVLPASALECDAVLSIGVGPDVSFDLEFARRGARVLMFDHTVERPPVPHENFVFRKAGWGVETAGDLLGFDAIHAEFSALAAKRPMLKFDIEGSEYDVLEALDADRLADFEVIVCELHDLRRLTEPEFHGRVRRGLQKLTRHHASVHLHANNYRGVAMVAGVPIPDVLEISLLRRDLDKFPGLSSEPIPGPLDRPNHPYVADICMTAF